MEPAAGAPCVAPPRFRCEMAQGHVGRRLTLETRREPWDAPPPPRERRPEAAGPGSEGRPAAGLPRIRLSSSARASASGREPICARGGAAEKHRAEPGSPRVSAAQLPPPAPPPGRPAKAPARRTPLKAGSAVRFLTSTPWVLHPPRAGDPETLTFSLELPSHPLSFTLGFSKIVSCK